MEEYIKLLKIEKEYKELKEENEKFVKYVISKNSSIVREYDIYKKDPEIRDSIPPHTYPY